MCKMLNHVLCELRLVSVFFIAFSITSPNKTRSQNNQPNNKQTNKQKQTNDKKQQHKTNKHYKQRIFRRLSSNMKFVSYLCRSDYFSTRQKITRLARSVASAVLRRSIQVVSLRAESAKRLDKIDTPTSHAHYTTLQVQWPQTRSRVNLVLSDCGHNHLLPKHVGLYERVNRFTKKLMAYRYEI